MSERTRGGQRRRPVSPQPRRITAPSSVSPARRCAFVVVRRVFEQGAYADRAFAAEATGLPARERALAMVLAYGTVQRRATLDFVAARLSRRPLTSLQPSVLAALRLGIFQLLMLDGVAEHAAVHESVELAKRDSPGGALLVNAVLRQAGRHGAEILAALRDDEPIGAATLHSVPQWLAQMWFDELGAAAARALLASINAPAESAVRVNTLVAEPAEVARTLPVPAAPAAGLPEGLVLGAAFDVQSSPLWRSGMVMAQSRASMLVARALAPEPGQRVLDLCAAPGAKTTHLAALMNDHGEISALERHPGRARALARTCAQMHAESVAVQVGDATRYASDRPFDRVLVDAPCSGLGTLASRPDLRWRASPEGIERLAVLQEQILAAAAQATARRGALVYSVCTISRAETGRVMQRFLHAHPEFIAEPLPEQIVSAGDGGASPFLQLLPHVSGTDGFFIARLRRS